MQRIEADAEVENIENIPQVVPQASAVLMDLVQNEVVKVDEESPSKKKRKR